MLRMRENLQTPTIRIDRSYEIDRFTLLTVWSFGVIVAHLVASPNWRWQEA
jgi:hypothetical protein